MNTRGERRQEASLDALRRLESMRSDLNHRLLKNSVLERIGTGDGTVADNFDEKARLIERAWCAGPDGEGTETERKTVASVSEGLQNWPAAKEAIRDFFAETPERLGVGRTEAFEAAKRQALDQPDGWLSAMDRFLSRFWELGKLDVPEQEKKVRQFWEAADALHAKLTEMRAHADDDDSPRFADFFTISEAE